MSIDMDFPMGNKVEVKAIRPGDEIDTTSIKNFLSGEMARSILPKIRIKKEKVIDGYEYSAKVYVFTQNQFDALVASYSTVASLNTPESKAE